MPEDSNDPLTNSETNLELILTRIKSFNLQTDVPLAPFTTLKIGGPTRFFVKAETERHVIEAFEFAKENKLELFVLGGGSNILVSDQGFDGLVLQIAIKGILSEPPSVAGGLTRLMEPSIDETNCLQPPAPAGGSDTLHTYLVTAAAGEDWDDFVRYCVDRNLAGVECLSGIPGFVGGTPVQNVGAYGQEVSETIESVRCLDRSTGETVHLSNAECEFTYRTSLFNTLMRDRFIVLSVTYALTQGGEPKIVYKDLVDYFAENMAAERRQDASVPPKGVTLSEAREAVLEIRASKSMVIDACDPNSRSAGSFFKNPIVNKEKLAEIGKKLGIGSVPHFTMDEKNVKIPAAWLIEQSGFYKGFILGNAAISTNHSLAIINRGGASAAEILALKDLIQGEVGTKFGIELRPEPLFVGFKERI
ncbi:UDP-N-acetylmuramate dehydrogenase [soil metagenome]